MKKCCVTGHRPEGFPFDYGDKSSAEYIRYKKEMERAVGELIAEGFDAFITGMARGVDTDFAETVLSYAEKGADITLEAAVPCPEQTTSWRDEDRERYEKLLSRCDKVTVLSPHYFNGCMQKRNRYMVDSSSAVLAFWNGERRGGTYSTVRYAEKQGKRLIVTELADLCK